MSTFDKPVRKMSHDEFAAFIRQGADIAFERFEPDEVEKYGEKVFDGVKFHFEDFVPTAYRASQFQFRQSGTELFQE